jgi:acetolactate synthase I/II/III large subunit
MNGAEALVRSLVASGVEVCFANPGTSEMHVVAALDRVPAMRAVLGLFEGVVTGAADGYGRMTGRPAATLLHLGPGLGNGFANLHNARRARTPIVNVIGEHATRHQRLDAPLTSDIESITAALDGWTRRIDSVADAGQDVAAAVAAAIGPPGRSANLILPADVAWTEGAVLADRRPLEPPAPPRAEVVSDAAQALRSGERVVLLLGAGGTRERGLVAAQRIATATGARVICETFPHRFERGAGLPRVPRLGYLAEQATTQLEGARHLVLAGAAAPVSFFAYPGKQSELTPVGCTVHHLSEPGQDVVAALEDLADELGTPAYQHRPTPGEPARPTGRLSPETIAAAVAATLPEGAIISDEAATSGRCVPAATIESPRHDLLTVTGGSIGQGLPVAVGAAVACPDRPVLSLQADGSAMYTISALWTMARESQNTTVVILDNAAYAVLRMELQRVGADPHSHAATQLLDLSNPRIDFVSLGSGMGVPSTRVETAEDLTAALEHAYAEPGPHLVHAVLPAAG